jgi:RNA polymerase sigma-70 factor (ECF subfamily)
VAHIKEGNVSTITLSMSDVSPSREVARISSPVRNSLADLVQALQNNHQDALEPLIKRTEKACYHLALSIVKDPELARDAVQESYFVVFLKIGQLREPEAFKSWLFRIVDRASHDILRKRKSEVQIDLQEREDLLSCETQTIQTDPQKEVSKRDLLRTIFSALPALDREAIALRELCNLSYLEMAQTLSIPIGTVRSRLAKARKRFLQAYRKEQQS